jgi:hypothetical protein
MEIDNKRMLRGHDQRVKECACHELCKPDRRSDSASARTARRGQSADLDDFPLREIPAVPNSISEMPQDLEGA